MKTRYDYYKKISEEDLEILEMYIFEKFGTIEAFTMEDQRKFYNTMDFGFYRLNYYFSKLWKAIKKDFKKLLNIRWHKSKK